MDWILDLLTPLGTTSNYSRLANLHLYKSLGHAKSSQSSLVVSRKRIYNSLTVNTARIKSPFHSHTLTTNFFLHSRTSKSTELPTLNKLPRFLNYLPTANSGTLKPLLCCNCQLSRYHLFSIIILYCSILLNSTLNCDQFTILCADSCQILKFESS
jgi:hypothetical protein